MRLARRILLIGSALGGFLLVLLVLAWITMIRMPGESYGGPPPPLTAREEALREALRADVETLAGDIGERHVQRYPQLAEAAAFVERSLTAAGYQVRRQGYEVFGKVCDNLEIDLPGASRPDEIVVVGAHYDSAIGTPGANDNATGTAAALALARAFSGSRFDRTVRLVFFVNEESPFTDSPPMGSVVYANRCRDRNENVVAMLSIETIGYYSDEPGSQRYPFPLSLLYPSTADFIAFVGNTSSRRLVRDAIASFRTHAQFPSVGGAPPGAIPGIGWSDHWAFWKAGYPGIMVTDTAPFRYPHYHTPEDTPDKIDYDRLARVVAGLQQVLADLAGQRTRAEEGALQ